MWSIVCGHCGTHHEDSTENSCPRIKHVERHPDGSIKVIEYRDTDGQVAARFAQDVAATVMMPSGPDKFAPDIAMRAAIGGV